MQSRFKTQLALAYWVLLLGASPLLGHPGLHHDIARISGQIDASPNRTDLLIKRAALYRLDGQPERALADLDQAARLGASDRDLLRERGFALADAGFTVRAENELEQHLNLEPRDARALALLGRLRAERGANEAAIDALRRATEIDPSVELTMALGPLLESTGQLDEAATLYRDAMIRLGQPIVIAQALIRVETTRGRFEEALALVDDLIARSPVATMWRTQRAIILRRMGDQDGADIALHAALAEANRSIRHKRTALHLYHRARVYAELGNSAEATADLHAAIRLAPGFKPPLELLEQVSVHSVSKERHDLDQ